MTIILRPDLGERLLLKTNAISAQGNGFLYVTNLAVAYEVDRHGIYLNFIPHTTIKKLSMHRGMMGAKKFLLEWEEDTQKFAFEFRTHNYAKLCSIITKVGICLA